MFFDRIHGHSLILRHKCRYSIFLMCSTDKNLCWRRREKFSGIYLLTQWRPWCNFDGDLLFWCWRWNLICWHWWWIYFCFGKYHFLLAIFLLRFCSDWRCTWLTWSVAWEEFLNHPVPAFLNILLRIYWANLSIFHKFHKMVYLW